MKTRKRRVSAALEISSSDALALIIMETECHKTRCEVNCKSG